VEKVRLLERMLGSAGPLKDAGEMVQIVEEGHIRTTAEVEQLYFG
jgi:hypothetical protein